VTQGLISLFHYLFFGLTIMEEDLIVYLWTNIVYTTLPLLPLSFTFFWKVTTLHGTVSFLKSAQCLKKCMQQNRINNNDVNKSDFRLDYNHNHNLNEPEKTSHSSNKQNEIIQMEPLKKVYHQQHQTDFDGESTKLTITQQIDDEVSIEHRSHLNQDDYSQINNLSSIDSLLADIAFKDNKNNKLLNKYPLFVMNSDKCCCNDYFGLFKVWRKIKFYLRIVGIILFNRNIITKDLDVDILNAPFIYYTNFFIGLGIITVFNSIFKFNLNPSEGGGAFKIEMDSN
jgi:hypothetical protein